jgi:hypothetical protein
VAKGRKTGGRDFKKGQSGNPSGAAPVPEDIKEARKLTNFEFERLANKYLFGTAADIEKASKDPNTPLIELLVGSVIHKGVLEGDERRLDFLLNRLVGKVKDEIKHTGSIASAPATVVILPAKDRSPDADGN